MALKFYNTLSKNIEVFKPINEKSVGLYTCGPTVYNYAHIGNFRAYLFGDTVKRALLYSGYSVNHIMNLTDVDDKTIRDSQSINKTLEEFTVFYANEFKNDSTKLNILPPTKYTRAVEHINQMVSLIEKLIEKGFAYKSEDGSIYFNVRKDSNYGQLSPITISEQKENAAGRISKDEYEKDNANDFALWKSWTESDGDVFWNTTLGKGRPGWHIECSAMSMEYLGETFDIHTGGVDLIFPHHENEIAQSECATNKKFVNYWMHNEWVMVEGKKMAKSAGNFVTLQTIIERGINPLAFRMLMLMSHYKSPANFTWDALEGAETALKRLSNHFLDLGQYTGKVSEKYKKEFKEHVENDLNTPLALATVWELVKDTEINNADKKATLLDFDSVLGLGLDKIQKEEIPENILEIAKEREEARKEKNWQKSDELRNKIRDMGYELKDESSGPVISKI